jgi:hypothetical protein
MKVFKFPQDITHMSELEAINKQAPEVIAEQTVEQVAEVTEVAENVEVADEKVAPKTNGSKKKKA